MKTKRCSKCGQDRPLEEMKAKHGPCRQCKTEYQREWRRRNRKSYGKIHGNLTKAKAAAYNKQWRKDNPDKSKAARRKTRLGKYGLSVDDFSQMKKEQNHRCAICGQKAKLVVDHCHSSGQVRGLLCDSCNKALGFARDEPDLLKRMVKYLK